MTTSHASQSPFTTIGLENCLASLPAVLSGVRFGLLVNQASVDHRFRYAHDLLAAALPGQLAALFSPQHGLWSEDQDNMIETPHGRHPRLGVPVYSLYAESRKPSAESLEGLDCLVVDLQDVGTRVYTYIWTLSLLPGSVPRSGGFPVVVLDRPNPLGGARVEGPRLRRGLHEFRRPGADADAPRADDRGNGTVPESQRWELGPRWKSCR